MNAREIRNRQTPIWSSFGRTDLHPMTGTSKFLGTVIDGGSLPTAADKFCLVNPTDVAGTESEGYPVVFLPDTTQKIPAVVLGLAPVVGDQIVFHSIGGRWVGRKRGSGGSTGGTGTIPTCNCTAIPVTLHMVSSNHTCNGGYFQDDTIVYGPTDPAYAALSLGANTFVGITDFPDAILGSTYRYLLSCNYNQFSLTQIYKTSPFGSPYRSGIIASWLVGAAGDPNSCCPTSPPCATGTSPVLQLNVCDAATAASLGCAGLVLTINS